MEAKLLYLKDATSMIFIKQCTNRAFKEKTIRKLYVVIHRLLKISSNAKLIEDEDYFRAERVSRGINVIFYKKLKNHSV